MTYILIEMYKKKFFKQTKKILIVLSKTFRTSKFSRKYELIDGHQDLKIFFYATNTANISWIIRLERASSDLSHVISKNLCPGSCFSRLTCTFQILSLIHYFNFPFSISMTTCSTVAALGMMPLCLYLYTLSWNLEQNLTLPYQNIGLYEFRKWNSNNNGGSKNNSYCLLCVSFMQGF